MDVDKARVTELLEHLRERIKYLQDFRVDSAETLEKSKKDFFALKNLLYEAVMDVIRVGQHIIAALQLEKPKTYRDTLRILGENRIIPFELGRKIEKMGGFRVVLAHDYEKVSTEDIYRLHLKTDDFMDFILAIEQFLEKQG